jgi:hypothetical protein
MERVHSQRRNYSNIMLMLFPSLSHAYTHTAIRIHNVGGEYGDVPIGLQLDEASDERISHININLYI